MQSGKEKQLVLGRVMMVWALVLMVGDTYM
jgi:hypothetical protein